MQSSWVYSSPGSKVSHCEIEHKHTRYAALTALLHHSCNLAPSLPVRITLMSHHSRLPEHYSRSTTVGPYEYELTRTVCELTFLAALNAGGDRVPAGVWHHRGHARARKGRARGQCAQREAIHLQSGSPR
eukprot:1187214-Prorocentrum_minimum.AAC.5